jgi:formylglycine-generating enzyme required for sulfatase activity
VKYCLLAVASIFTFFSNAQTDTSFKSYTQLIPGTNVQFKMVPIPAGSFLMGSTDTDKDAEKDEMPQRNFSVSAFWMGAYEVTHDEFN